jgi:hypothetical protein
MFGEGGSAVALRMARKAKSSSLIPVILQNAYSDVLLEKRGSFILKEAINSVAFSVQLDAMILWVVAT